MKKMKKLGALILSLVMVAAMSVNAFAVPADLVGDGVVGDFTTPDTPVVQDRSVILYKEITAYNPETCTVNAPTVTYAYGIAAGEAGKDILDVASAHATNASAHATTKAGVGTPVISGSVDGGTNYTAGQLVFTPAVQFSASSAGTKNAYNLKVDFSSIDFTTAGSGAGVYRYVITETLADSAKNAAGISDGTISNIRYMDVYVDGAGNIYGYTCFQNNNSISAADTLTSAAKTEGFVATNAGGADGATAQSADSYYTFNFEVKKVVANDSFAATTHHQFPFTITLDNPNVTAAVLPIMSVGSNATQTALSAAAIGTGNAATVWTPTISDGASISYVGIPCGTTVTINETNDVTGVTYSSVSANADTNAAQKYIDTGAVSNNAIINCTSYITAAAENHTAAQSKQIVFTNTLIQISPTGVVLRVAPYAIMLAAGMFLVLLAISKRREQEEA